MTQLEGSALKAHVGSRADLQDEAEVYVDQPALCVDQDLAVVPVLGLEQVAGYGIPVEWSKSRAIVWQKGLVEVSTLQYHYIALAGYACDCLDRACHAMHTDSMHPAWRATRNTAHSSGGSMLLKVGRGCTRLTECS